VRISPVEAMERPSRFQIKELTTSALVMSGTVVHQWT